MATDRASYLPELHKLLNDHFNVAEIRTLCLQLDVDYESMAGEEKSSRIRELLLAMGRRGRLPELITLVQEERPDVDWPTVPDDFELPKSLASSGTAVPADQYQIDVEGSITGAAIGAGASVSADIIAGGDVHIGYTAEQVSLLINEIGHEEQPTVWDGRIPYLGLTAFREGDAQFFFGRESLVDDLLARIEQSSFVVISGPSGSGKSSIARAGLFHALQQGRLEQSDRWLLAAMQPGGSPLEALTKAIERIAKAPNAGDYLRENGLSEPLALHRQIETLLTDDPQQRFVLLVDQFEEIFTQTITTERIDERTAFINLITIAAQAEKSRTIIVLALRSDFVSQCAAYPELRALMSQQFQLVGAIDPPDLARAITLPAMEVGAGIDPALVSQIMEDMKGEPGALPLMSFALRDLFMAEMTTKGERINLTRQKYLERGGIESALERHANHVFESFNDEQKELAKGIFSKLITVGAGRMDTRRTASFEELKPAGSDEEAVAVVVGMLAAEGVRLVTTSGVKSDEDMTAEEMVIARTTVTIAHEKLIDAWPWLRRLVDNNREIIAMQNEINNRAQKWAKDQDPGYLYRGGLLLQVEENMDALQPNLDDQSLSLIQASIEARDAETRAEEERIRQREAQRQRELVAAQELAKARQGELEAQQRRTKSVRQALVGLLFLLLIAVVATAFAISAGQRANDEAESAVASEATAQAAATEAIAAQETAEEERQRAEDLTKDLLIRQLVRESENLIDDRYDQSLLLSIEAFRLDDTIETRNNLLQVLRTRPELVRYIHDPDEPMVITFSPDGETIVTLTGSGIELWDVSTGAAIKPISSEINGINVLSRDEETGFSAESQTILLWDLASDQSHNFLGGRQSDDVSPDGNILASWLESDMIGLQDVKTGSQFGELRDGWLENGYLLTFSPDSRILVTASPNSTDPPQETVLAWELPQLLTDYQEFGEFSSREADDRWSFCGEDCATIVGSVTNIFFDSDGQFLAVTVQENNDVHYLLLSRRNPIELWRGEPSLTSLTANCDNGFVVGREDGKILFFDITFSSDLGADLTPSRSPLNHPGSVTALVFSPDCHHLVSLGSGEIVLWNVEARDVEPFELIDTRPAIDTSIAAWDHSGTVSWSSPDGKMTATSECSRTRNQLDPSSYCIQSAISGGFVGFTGTVTSLAISPDGGTLVAGICHEVYDNAPDPPVCGHSGVWIWPAGPNDAIYLGDQEFVVTELIFSPDGKTLDSIGQDGTIMKWDVDPESLATLACDRANRNLTDDEWIDLGFDPPDSLTCPSVVTFETGDN